MKTYPIRDVTGDRYLNPASKLISSSSLKALSGMMFLMLTFSKQLKVLNAVVHSVLVDMVNMLVWAKRSTKILLHDIAMFINVQVIIVQVAILHTFTSFVTRLPIWVGSPLMFHSTASTAKKTFTTIVVNALKSKFHRAKSTLHDIVKATLLTRNFTFNNPFVHTIIILQGDRNA